MSAVKVYTVARDGSYPHSHLCFLKVLRRDMVHFGKRYYTGLNTDHNMFNPNGVCDAGGLYFTTEDNIDIFYNYGECIADVTLPPGASYCMEGEYKWKASSIRIENIRTINKYKEELALRKSNTAIGNGFLSGPSSSYGGRSSTNTAPPPTPDNSGSYLIPIVLFFGSIFLLKK